MNPYGLIVAFVVILIIVMVIIITSCSNHQHHQHHQFNIQHGITSGSNDSMHTGGNNLYIVNSTMPLTLSIMSSPSNKEGTTIAIKNASSHNTTLVGGSHVSLDSGMLNLTVTPGKTAYFVATSTNRFLRLA